MESFLGLSNKSRHGFTISRFVLVPVSLVRKLIRKLLPGRGKAKGSEMALWGKSLMHKPDDPSLIPGTHIKMEAEN